MQVKYLSVHSFGQNHNKLPAVTLICLKYLHVQYIYFERNDKKTEEYLNIKSAWYFY